MEQRFAPGYVVVEDRPLLVYPAAGWIHEHRLAYGTSGYLVQHPADHFPQLMGRIAYYVQATTGQLVRAWAGVVQSLSLNHRRVSMRLLEGHIQQGDGREVEVLRCMDDTGLSVYGYSVVEYSIDLAKAEAEGRLAGPEVQRLVADMEAWRGRL